MARLDIPLTADAPLSTRERPHDLRSVVSLRIRGPPVHVERHAHISAEPLGHPIVSVVRRSVAEQCNVVRRGRGEGQQRQDGEAQRQVTQHPTAVGSALVSRRDKNLTRARASVHGARR